jgi:UDP-N-acetyl-D-mannosaminuronate dehydrogenase
MVLILRPNTCLSSCKDKPRKPPETMFNRISMIGHGDIDLPTATLFASRGKQVIGVDMSLQAVKRRQIP